MKFNEFKYVRPDLEQFISQMKELLEVIGKDVTFEEELKAIMKVFSLNDDLSTQASLVSIRNSVDTRDEFYEKEQEFFNENMPKIQEYEHMFSTQLLESKNRQKLEKEIGSLIFVNAELQQKTFDVKIIEDLQLENKLSTEYSKLLAGAKIEFDGGEYN